MSDGNYQSWMNGTTKDIAISHEDYLEILACLTQNRLSEKMIFRFKNLAEVNSWSMMYVPII